MMTAKESSRGSVMRHEGNAMTAKMLEKQRRNARRRKGADRKVTRWSNCNELIFKSCGLNYSLYWKVCIRSYTKKKLNIE